MTRTRCRPTSWSFATRASAPGFTLVEMLIIVMIIITLLAILGPTIGRAVYLANQSKCASNKRQIMMGLFNYLDDNLKRYPNENIPTSVGYHLQDHTPIFFPTLRDRYGVSFRLWSCPVAGEHLVPYDWNGWKWKMGSTAYWVMRGRSGSASSPSASGGILPDALWLQRPNNVVVSDSLHGNTAALTNSYHSYNGKVEQGVIAQVDGSSHVIQAYTMLKRHDAWPGSWPSWWY